MGSTVETARRFGRFDKDGKTYIAWFSTTYDSRTFPHHPDEECFTFGTIDAVSYLVAGAAFDAHSGMLRRPGGDFTPTGFIQTYAKALKTPFRLADRSITLRVGKGFDDAIAPGDLSAYSKLMIQAGFVNEFVELRQKGETSFMLHDKPELVALLARRSMNPHVSAWRVIRPSLGNEGAFPAAPLELPVAPPAAFKLWKVSTESSSGVLLGRLGDETLIGTKYEVVHAIIGRCEDIEQQMPGAGIATIRAIDKAAKGTVSAAPDDVEIVIDIRDGMDKWHEDSVRDFLASLPAGSEIEHGYHRTTVGRMREQNASLGFFNQYPFSTKIKANIPPAEPEADLLSRVA